MAYALSQGGFDGGLRGCVAVRRAARHARARGAAHSRERGLRVALRALAAFVTRRAAARAAARRALNYYRSGVLAVGFYGWHSGARARRAHRARARRADAHRAAGPAKAGGAGGAGGAKHLTAEDIRGGNARWGGWDKIP